MMNGDKTRSMFRRRWALALFLVGPTLVGLAACTGSPGPVQLVSTNPAPTSSPAADYALLHELCGEATEINTLVRLPDIQISSTDPKVERITVDEWRASITEAKEAAIGLLLEDSGAYRSEVRAFASAVLLTVSDAPPVSWSDDAHPELTAATADLNAVCIPIGMEIGIRVPASFGR